MANIDQSVTAVLDRAGNTSDLDEDDLIAQLENDDALDGLRERRLQQLHEEVTRQKVLRQSEHGTYTEIKDEKSLMDITTSTKLCVVHFFRPDFNRCRIMDKHIETLASIHLDTRFVKINVDNAPFLVARLKVQVLPCVLAFVDGVSKDRILGFEGLAGGDNFTTRQLETRLLQAGVLVRKKLTKGREMSAKQKAKDYGNPGSDYDDDEWD